MLVVLLVATGARAQAPALPFDIPRMDAVVVDGKGGDWGEAGFRVPGIRRFGAPTPTSVQIDARLGWDAEGLLGLVRVADNAWTPADGLELSLSARRGDPNILQWTVRPAEGATGGVARTFRDLRRAPELKSRPAEIQSSASREPASDNAWVPVVYEFRIPWAGLGIVPALEREVAAQLVVLDSDGGGVSRNVWYEGRDLYLYPDHMQRVCLTGAEGAAERERQRAEERVFADLDKRRLGFSGYVFQGPSFPSCDFAEAAAARRVMPDCEIGVRFFDADYNAVTQAVRSGRYGALVTYGNQTATRRKCVTLFRVATETNGPAQGAEPLSLKTGISEALVGTYRAVIDEALRRRKTDDAITLAVLRDRTEGHGLDLFISKPEVREGQWWAGLLRRLGEDPAPVSPIPFAVFTPEGYEEKPDQSFGLLLYGPGREFDCDGTWEGLARHPAACLFRGPDAAPCPFIVAIPSCFRGEEPEALVRIIDIVSLKYRVDPQRVFAVGKDSDVEAVRRLAARYAGRLAAAVSVAQGGAVRAALEESGKEGGGERENPPRPGGHPSKEGNGEGNPPRPDGHPSKEGNGEGNPPRPGGHPSKEGNWERTPPPPYTQDWYAWLAESTKERVSGPLSAPGAESVKPAKFIEALQTGRSQTVVALGTSLTSGGAWVNQLQKELDRRYPGLITVRNGGASGRNGGHGLSSVPWVVAESADAVLIEYSMNDAKDAFMPTEVARDTLEKTIDGIRRGLPECEIILMTMNNCAGGPAERRPNLNEFYQVYRDVAKERGLRCIDHYANWISIWETDPDRYWRYIPDGSHPGGEGCEAVITPEILRAIGVK